MTQFIAKPLSFDKFLELYPLDGRYELIDGESVRILATRHRENIADYVSKQLDKEVDRLKLNYRVSGRIVVSRRIALDHPAEHPQAGEGANLFSGAGSESTGSGGAASSGDEHPNVQKSIKEAAVKNLMSQNPDSAAVFLEGYIKSFKPSFTLKLLAQGWLETFAPPPGWNATRSPKIPTPLPTFAARLAQDGNRIVRAAALAPCSP